MCTHYSKVLVVNYRYALCAISSSRSMPFVPRRSLGSRRARRVTVLRTRLVCSSSGVVGEERDPHVSKKTRNYSTGKLGTPAEKGGGDECGSACHHHHSQQQGIPLVPASRRLYARRTTAHACPRRKIKNANVKGGPRDVEKYHAYER